MCSRGRGGRFRGGVGYPYFPVLGLVVAHLLKHLGCRSGSSSHWDSVYQGICGWFCGSGWCLFLGSDFGFCLSLEGGGDGSAVGGSNASFLSFRSLQMDSRSNSLTYGNLFLIHLTAIRQASSHSPFKEGYMVILNSWVVSKWCSVRVWRAFWRQFSALPFNINAVLSLGTAGWMVWESHNLTKGIEALEIPKDLVKVYR